MGFDQRLGSAFFARLQGDLRAAMAAEEIGCLLLDGAEDVLYASGFAHRPTERPVVLALTASEAVLLIPELERSHAAGQGIAAEPLVYFEYPGIESPLSLLARRLGRIEGKLAHGPGIPFARAEALATLFPAVPVVCTGLVGAQRLRKYPEEIALHREAGRISDAMVAAGVALLREGLAAGAPLPSEIEMERHVTRHALALMAREHENIVDVPVLAGGLVTGGLRTALPHGIESNRRFERGEGVILSLGCRVGGRAAESERTFFLGDPTQAQARAYGLAAGAQELGREAMRPGATCAGVDALALGHLRAAGMAPHILHRTGHGMGVAFHEPPWVEAGDPTPLAPSMVLSCEPGLYVAGLGGFRLADTVLVGSDGPDSLTHYPRSLEDSVIG